MIILGIDPGTAITGFAIIEGQRGNQKPRVIDFGCIITEKTESPARRLDIIHREVSSLIKKHKPEIMAIESLYFFKNLKTALPVSQAKGVVLLAASQKNIPIFEFTPLQVKMSVVGYGRAEKKQVQKMTQELLDLSSFNTKEKNRKKDDAADALGVALCGLIRVWDINYKSI